MTSNARNRILDGALELLRTEGGGAITLDASAKQVGLTKPGLMYHFPTKDALMCGVVEHVADRWEALLLARLGGPPESAVAHERIRAYVEVTMTAPFDRADFVIYSDVHYRAPLTEIWQRRLAPWLALPADLPATERARLTAARMAADGYWTAAATGVFPVSEGDRAAFGSVLDGLVDDGLVDGGAVR